MKRFFLFLFAIAMSAVIGAAQISSAAPTTSLTRDFLKQSTTAGARAVIGATAGSDLNLNTNQFSTSNGTNAWIKSGATLTNSVLYGSTSGNWTVGTTGNLTSDTARTITTTTGNLTLSTSGGNGNVLVIPNGTGYLDLNQSTPTLRLTSSSSATQGGLFYYSGSSLDGQITLQPSTAELRLTVGRSVAWGGKMTFFTDTVEVGRFTSAGNFLVGTTSETGLTGAGGLRVASATDSASTTTGSAVFSGGVGVAKTLYVGTGVNITGDTVLEKTITAGGTTGAQTINKNSGSVNFAAAATSLVVTCNKVTANSVITATVASNDSTMKSVAVVAGAGSFTLYANAAPTAETRVNFRITN